MKRNLALISPNLNAYSETFIQNHKKHLDANVKYYYGGYLPAFLEEEARLGLSRLERCSRYINQYIFKKNFKYSENEKALINSFKKHKIDVVYAEYGTTGAVITNICKALNIPLIVNFHGSDASIYEILDKYTEPYRTMFEYASNIVVVSQYMAQTLISLGCNPLKIIYTPCAPDDLFFTIKPTYTENAFLSVGRFTDKKAPYYTIMAFQKVVGKYPDAKLYMAGNGVLFNTCTNIAKYLNIEKNITFLGAIKQEELISYFQKVKAFVQHSITATNGDMEGTPVAILEASAAGLPVISTKHAGIPDVIIDEETGLLVDEHDVDGMAEKMIRLLDNPDLAEKMGRAGRKNIFEKYRMEIHMDKLNNVIHSLIK